MKRDVDSLIGTELSEGTHTDTSLDTNRRIVLDLEGADAVH